MEIFNGQNRIEFAKVGRSSDTKKKKIVCAAELKDDGKVKRMYSLNIYNYSAKELGNIFDNLIRRIGKADKIIKQN